MESKKLMIIYNPKRLADISNKADKNLTTTIPDGACLMR